MENFISIYESALSSDKCELIIDDINSSNLEPGVILGNVVNKENKDSLDVPRNFIDYSPTSIIIGNALHPCKEDYIKKHPQLNKFMCGT